MLGMSDVRTSVVYKARYRRWLADDIGFDVGVGGGHFGLIGEVAVEYRDLFGVEAALNTVPIGGNQHGVVATVGVRCGTEVVGLLLYGLAMVAADAIRMHI